MSGRPPKSRPPPPNKQRPGPPGSRPGPPGSRPGPPGSRPGPPGSRPGPPGSKARPGSRPPKSRPGSAPPKARPGSAPPKARPGSAPKSRGKPPGSRPPPPNGSTNRGPSLPPASYKKTSPSPSLPPASYKKASPSPSLPPASYKKGAPSPSLPPASYKKGAPKLRPSPTEKKATPSHKPKMPSRFRAVTAQDDDDFDNDEESDNMYKSANIAPPQRGSVPISNSKGKPGTKKKNNLIGLSPPDKDDAICIHEGYLMKRIGLGAAVTHYWEVRFFRIEKDPKHGNMLHWWSTHFQSTKKGKLKIQSGISSTMSFERNAYDEGRRRNLFGIQQKVKGSPIVLDAPSPQVKRKWIELFLSLGCTDRGMVLASKTNQQSLREGWIVKQGEKVGTWHRRFLVLLPQVAMYYKWKSDKRPQGVIPLSSSGKVTVAPITKGKNIISLKPATGGREYFIRCLDAEELGAWIDAFALAMKKK